MAVQAEVKESRLRLSFVTGTDAEGNEVIKTSTMGNLDPAATDDAVMTVASTLTGLQTTPLRQVIKASETVLTQI